MGDATRAYFLTVLDDCSQRLEASGVEHALIGSLARAIVQGLDWRTAEDVDFFVRKDDAERLLDLFSEAGYATHRRDERWIYKVAQPNVTVDLIFQSAESIAFDDEHYARSSLKELDGVRVRVAAPEDLLMSIALTVDAERQGQWYGCLDLLRNCQIDWDYLARRAVANGPARLGSLLLFATTDGIDVPRETLTTVLEAVDRLSEG